ncbi:MAG: hypothetical protein ACHREM_12700, partial [Polyangiales bacterium]
CTDWFAVVDKTLPTLVVSARDETGNDLTSVQVTLDDVVVASALDGRAIAVDPGRHTLRLACAGHADFAQSIVVVEAEKDRRIEAVLGRIGVPAPIASSPPPTTPSPSPTSPPPTTTRSTTAPLLLGAIGAVSLASWGYFGITSFTRYRELRDSCGRSCDPSDVHALEIRSAIADASLGVGVVAIGAAAWIWLASAPSEASTTPTVSVSPTPGGAIGWIGGRF